MSSPVYQFGDFQLDCGRFELFRKGHSLRVERKPMDLLILLVKSQGQLVSRAEIAQRLWSSEVFVDTEHGINTAIRKLRHLLRDDPENPQFIQTVTGMGYRFIAPVSVDAPVATDEPPPHVEQTSAPALSVSSRSKQSSWGWYAAAGVSALLAFGGGGLYRLRHRAPEIQYTQLTDFTDSAVQPSLSADGHMLAFIRGGNSFITSDQIYVKILPDGEPRRVTDDTRPKYGLAFSPDGSEIAYTVLEGPVFSTYQVSTLGGEPQLLRKNAAGLVWLNSQRLLFSEAPSGIHLSVVSASVTREDLRMIYSPAHERGMAHYSFPSPDRRWAVVVEMAGNGDWAPCRLIPLEGPNTSRAIGPSGECTSAGWSADGAWMYFSATVQGQSHIWRQHFPEGEPEQITSGPTEEEGIAVDPDGRSLITSVGVHESAIWIHDSRGERSLSSEGEVLWNPHPVFSPDASAIYYLLRRRESSNAELWRTIIESGKSDPIFPGLSMTAFDISPDGRQVVYTTGDAKGSVELWLAQVDRSSPPVRVNIVGAQAPRFGSHSQIIFTRSEGSVNYLEQINPDGTHLSKVLAYPVLDLQDISPDRKWVTVDVPRMPGDNSAASSAIPLDGGSPRRLCVSYCASGWSRDGKYLFVPLEDPSRTSPGRSLAIPLGPKGALPDIPAGGIAPMASANVIQGAISIGRAGLVPGKDPSEYAWVNTTTHRNLYRLSLP